jgi:hypothetical protein
VKRPGLVLTMLFWFVFCSATPLLGTDLPGAAAPSCAAALRTSHQCQQVLVRYAKGQFLHLLGFGAAPAPPPWLARMQGGCFVTFLVANRVIACAGGFQPRTADFGAELAANVRQALHLDARAAGIDRLTARRARVLITFPGAVYPLSDPGLVDPARQGLFVENDRFGVAIVPGEAKTAAWAAREALRRLGERDRAAVRWYVFDAWVVVGHQ